MTQTRKRPASKPQTKSSSAKRSKAVTSKTKTKTKAKSTTAKKSLSQSSSKKSKARKSPARKSSTSKSTKKKAATISVDSLLRKFEKERTQKEQLLQTLQARQVDLHEKTRKMQEQIATNKDRIKETQSLLSNLDADRDAQVKELLAKLGVQIDSAGPSPLGSSTAHSSSDTDSSSAEKSTADETRQSPQSPMSFANGRE